MIYLDTEKNGLVSGVTLTTIVRREYGPTAKLTAWDEISEDGVMGLVVQKNPKKDGWDVLDHVYGIFNDVTMKSEPRPKWI